METTFIVSPSSTTIVKSGGTQNITVTSSDYDWSVNTDANWIQVSPNSGTTGETTVVLTTEDNPYFQRSGSVEFVNTNGESSSVTVTQSGNSNTESIIPLIRVGSTGNSYVNLNYTFSGDETIKIEGASISKYAGSGATLFSITNSSGQTKVSVQYSGTKLNGNLTSGLFAFASPYDYFIANSTIEITPTEIKVNGETNVPNRVNSLSGDCTITLFARTPQGSFSANNGWDLITVGAFTIYDSSNNVKARFVPVMLNESTATLRYYEEITKTLYTFSGSGSITPIDTYLNQYNKINVGGNQIEDLYIGQTEIQTAYIGSSLAKLPKREINYIYGVGLTTPVQDGTKHFYDTGIRPKTTTKFKIYGIWRGKTNGECIVGSRYVVSNAAYRFFCTGGKAYFDFNNSRVYLSNQNVTSGDTFNYECGNNYIKVVDQSTGTTQTTVSEDRTIKIYIDSIYVKQLQIWEDNTLVFDAKPIANPYKNSSAIGLYDSVSNRVLFYCYYNKS